MVMVRQHNDGCGVLVHVGFCAVTVLDWTITVKLRNKNFHVNHARLLVGRGEVRRRPERGGVLDRDPGDDRRRSPVPRPAEAGQRPRTEAALAVVNRDLPATLRESEH